MAAPDFTRDHPSYAIVQIARTSGRSSRVLFGSPLEQHYTTVRLTISRATWTHADHQDRFHGSSKDELIEIELSAAQFASMITTMNTDVGTPCTVRRLGATLVEPPPPYPTTTEHLRASFEATISGYTDKVRAYRKRIEAVASKLPLKARGELKGALDVIEHLIASNAPFVMQQFQEATARITAAAKADVDAFVTHALRAAGLQAFTEGP